MENDEICFIEGGQDAVIQKEYKQKLGEIQKEKADRILAILEKEFGIKLKLLYTIPFDSQDKSV